MNLWKKLAGGVALSAAAVAITQPVLAQEVSSGIRGTVNLANGQPAAGVAVSLLDTRTGVTRTDTTGAAGAFDLRGLNVGGPYTISVSAAGQQPIRVEGIEISLGSETDVNLKFTGAAATETVVITAANSGVVQQQAVGPTAAFGLSDLQHAPAINSDVKDVLKLDPRIYLDESFGGAAGNDGIQCGGSHPRFTSLTVDGVTMSDGFGLSANNYPSERMPFPFEAINQVSVELAPFSVLYGGFTGCNVNAVTKSGTNAFHGSAYYDYTNNGLRSHLKESPLARIQTHQTTDTVPNFEEKRYAGTLGGPIIPDRLFFFGAYEKADFSNFFTRGPVGSGASVVPNGLDQATYQAIIDTAKNKYGYDPGGTTLSSPQTDEKYLGRIDFNITDRQRLVLSYDHSKAFQLIEANSGASAFEFSSHLYQRGGVLDAYNAELFSDWTDQFSTELRYAQNDWDGTVRCQGGPQFGEVQITLASGTNVFFGCDRSRQANDLNYTVKTLVANGTYRAGEHNILAGYELRKYSIFDLFEQNASGTYIFSGGAGVGTGDGLTNFEDGLATQVLYANAVGTNDVANTAAKFGYDIHTGYVQDDIHHGAFDITTGLRYELYESSDSPRFNSKFFQRYGFANTKTFDNLYVVQPRFGVTWDATPDIKFHGGAGYFSGGDPNVFLSNSYANDGVESLSLTAQIPASGPATTFGVPTSSTFPRVFDLFSTAATYQNDERTSPTVNPIGAIWGIPTGLFNAIANASAQDNPVNAVDPTFRIPAAWKFDVGGSWNFDLPWLGKDFFLTADWLLSKDTYAANVVDLTLQRVGTAPDGQAVYRRIDKSNPACIANPGTVTSLSPIAGCARTTSDLELTNDPGGYESVISFDITKNWRWGLDATLGYAHTDAKDRTPITSSTASSNYTNTTATDFNNLALRNSNYENPNRWTMELAYHHAFFGDYNTRVTLTGQAWQSKDYTFSFASFNGVTGVFASDGAWGDNNSFAHPLYVPSGPGPADDPKVTYSAAFLAHTGPNGKSGLDQLNDLIAQYHLPRGQTLARNEFDGQWNNKFDLKLEQELPGGFRGSKVTGFVIVENLGNMLNDHWGQVYEAPFPSRTATVAASINTAGQYVYQLPSGQTTASNNLITSVPPGWTAQAEQIVPAVSFWTVKLGLRYSF